jgi:Holliday junction resolvasome RuvABC ATP-dependent DNA helicase subunit
MPHRRLFALIDDQVVDVSRVAHSIAIDIAVLAESGEHALPELQLEQRRSLGIECKLLSVLMISAVDQVDNVGINELAVRLGQAAETLRKITQPASRKNNNIVDFIRK